MLQLAENAGFDWVRQQVPWKDTEKSDRTFGWDELDQIVESVSGQNRKLLLSIAKSPDFLTERSGDNGLPRDPKDFARFAEAIVERYKGKVQAIEVWNEQNLAVENGGEVVPEDASRYVEMLKEAYTRIKAVDPNVIVVAGALSSTGVTEPAIAVDDMTYLKAMYDYNGGESRIILTCKASIRPQRPTRPTPSILMILATLPAGTTTQRTSSAISRMCAPRWSMRDWVTRKSGSPKWVGRPRIILLAMNTVST